MSVTRESRRDIRRTFGVSHGTPTRPDPTRYVFGYDFHSSNGYLGRPPLVSLAASRSVR